MSTTLLRPALLVLGFSASLVVSACSGAEDEQDDGCATNEVDCECNGGECPGELVCVENLCTQPAGDSGTGDTTTGDTGTGDTTTG